MWLIIGTTRTLRELGHAADYCRVCREIRSCRIIRLGEATHLYYISFGKGKLLGHRSICRVCAFQNRCNIDKFSDILASPLVELEDLIELTFPNIHQQYAERIARDQAILAGEAALTDFQLEKEIKQLLVMLAETAEDGLQLSFRWRPTGCIGCSGLFFLYLAVDELGRKLIGNKTWIDHWFTPMFILIMLVAFGLFLTFFQFPSRYRRDFLMPQLKRGLAPLRPRLDQLEKVLMRLGRKQHPLALKLKAKKLYRLLRER